MASPTDLIHSNEQCSMKNSIAADEDFFNLLTYSHLRLTGHPLLPSDNPEINSPLWLYKNATFCVLAHNTENDPTFIYANLAAQRCFEYSWSEIVKLRSALSAEHSEKAEREQLLETVRRQGFSNHYSGIRITKSGKKIWIENATIWNLIDLNGIYRGQAATFHKWKNSD